MQIVLYKNSGINIRWLADHELKTSTLHIRKTTTNFLNQETEGTHQNIKEFYFVDKSNLLLLLIIKYESLFLLKYERSRNECYKISEIISINQISQNVFGEILFIFYCLNFGTYVGI